MTHTARIRQSIMTTLLALSLISFGFAGLNTAFAGEHPEHPSSGDSKEKKEHPEQTEHPEHPEAAIEINVDMMAEAITSYIEKDSKLKGGYFLVIDPNDGNVLELKLAKVHKEKLAQVGDNLFFACTDLNEKGGKVFDLDFFMESQGGHLMVTEVMVHKEDGKARYSWFEEDGIWKRK